MPVTEYRKVELLKVFELRARELIEGPDACHAQLQPLHIFIVGKDRGKTTVRKASPLIRYLTGPDAKRERPYDIIIEVFEPDLMLYEASLTAFADHVLSHIEMVGADEFAIQEPPVQEFLGVLERRGVWREPVEQMTQLPFVFEGEGQVVG